MTDLWQYLSTVNRPIVLYGTGDGADKILDVMSAKGLICRGIFASDGFVRSRSFRDMPVLSYEKARKQFGDDMIILIAFGSSLPSMLERFFTLASRHEVYAPDVPVAGGPLFDLSFYEENADKIEAARSLFADEHSLSLYNDMIQAKLCGDVAALGRNLSHDDDILFLLGTDEFRVTLDLGAYNGDTALRLIDTCPKLEAVIALEPDERNFRKLCLNTTGTRKVEAHYAAAWDKKEILTFRKGGGRGIRKQKGEKTVFVTGAPADSFLDGRKPDYIKIDVEGAERQAILGCQDSISRYDPALRIALYHRSADLFELPLMIREMNPSYRLYLRRTPSFPAWDLDLIAVSEKMRGRYE